MKQYYQAQLVEQEMVEVNEKPAIVLKAKLVAKEEKGKVIPIEPRDQAIWIFMPDRPNASFTVEEQVDMLEEAIFLHNPAWDGDYTDLGFTNFKVSVNKKGDKEYWNLVGPGKGGKTVSKADATKAWAKFSRRAKKRANPNAAASAPPAPESDPAPENREVPSILAQVDPF